jgi:regulator of RNase E activity RraB
MKKEIDQKRLTAELAADVDVVRSLLNNGDIPSVVRAVDVRFVGRAANIERLRAETNNQGWREVRTVVMSEVDIALDLARDQTTEPDALGALTEWALGVEIEFNVSYDGWGTVARSS